jgi:aspartate/methionine/tyrosine aminotransferase
MFSGRVPAILEPNRLTMALAQHHEQGRSALDLTASNPTRAGFSYPIDFLKPLADSRALEYSPSAAGLADARQAVANDSLRLGRVVAPDRIVLTASTSEAYSLAFKVFCDPGDTILIPRPSYPLFAHLSRLDGVNAVPYDLDYHGRWSIDLTSVERGLTARARLLLAVSPNNPTGNFVTAAEMHGLAKLCAARGVAIISDEVFRDYGWSPETASSAGSLLDHGDVLGITLGGLSKSIGLPQAKLAWLLLSGPASLVEQLSRRLEFAADTYLSVSTPVQVAAAALLAAGADIRRQIRHRINRNRTRLLELAAAVPSCRVLHAEGGWYAILQVPSLGSEEDLVLALLTDDNVLVHPGYFYDFQTESFLVVSLLTPERDFDEGIRRILKRFHERGVIE